MFQLSPFLEHFMTDEAPLPDIVPHYIPREVAYISPQSYNDTHIK